jgi:hypothetical protein
MNGLCAVRSILILLANAIQDGEQHQAVMPDLGLSPTHVTNASLQQLTTLTALDLSSNQFITDAAVSRLTKLQTLNLFDNRLVSGTCLVSLSHSLTSLSLYSNSEITDEALIQLTNLRKLVLTYNNSITNNALSVLSQLSSVDLSPMLESVV